MVRKYNKITPVKWGSDNALMANKGKGRIVFVPNKNFFKMFRRVK